MMKLLLITSFLVPSAVVDAARTGKKSDRLSNSSEELLSATYANTTMYERGISRLSKSSMEANNLLEKFFGPNATYSKDVLPKQARPGMPVTVRLLLTLIQLGDVDERNQIMSTMIWVNHEWQDVALSWDPNRYGGLTKFHIPSSAIWVPDTVLYNNADGDYQLSDRAKVTVHYSGTIRWEPPAIYRSFCLIDVTYFPFDDQACDLKIGPWTYDVGVVNYVHQRFPGQDFVADAIDRTRYFESVEWEIIAVPGNRHEVYYTGIPEGYVDITYTLLLRRKALFYTVNLIAPCLAISLLTIFVFYLPSESGEKVTLSISILLSLTFFIILLADLVPPTSLIIPLIGKYLLFTMILVTLSIMSTVVVLAVFRNPMNAVEPLPEWVRYTFLRILPRLLFMKLRKIEKSSELQKLESMLNAQEIRRQSHDYGSLSNDSTEFVDFSPKDKMGYKKFKKQRPPQVPPRNSKTKQSIMSDHSGSFAFKAKHDGITVHNPAYEQTYEVVWRLKGNPAKAGQNPQFASSATRSLSRDMSDSLDENQSQASSSATYRVVNGKYSYIDLTSNHIGPNDDDIGQYYENTTAKNFMRERLVYDTLEKVSDIVEHCRVTENEVWQQGQWETVARVLDRLFLVLYSGSCVFGILTILLSAPSIWGVDHKAVAEFRRLAGLNNTTTRIY